MGARAEDGWIAVAAERPRGAVGDGARPTTDPAVVGAHLCDASGRRGRARALVRPESEADVAQVLRDGAARGEPVTVVASQTSTTGSSVPDGGLLLHTGRLRGDVALDGSRVTVGVGHLLGAVQARVAAAGWLLPPDPTSRHECSVGGAVACNASGPRSFRYGATRRYVRGLRVVLVSGDVLALERGQAVADAGFEIRHSDGSASRVPVPVYPTPAAAKHAAGIPSGPGLDLVDVFVGSEGTLGVVTEVVFDLVPLPERVWALWLAFPTAEAGLAFVRAVRAAPRAGAGVAPRCLEWFDAASLAFVRDRCPDVPVPERAGCVVFAEQEATAKEESERLEAWSALAEAHGVLSEPGGVIAAAEPSAHERLREARHAVPVGVNELAAERGMEKLGTDLAVPDAYLDALMALYQQAGAAPRGLLDRGAQEALVRRCGVPDATALDEAWRAAGLPETLETTVFGHVGDNHLHVNFTPGSSAERALAEAVYAELTRRALAWGGTPSAEHGIGKLKHAAFRALLGDAGLESLAALRRALDPAQCLGQGNWWPASAAA
ncbi:MAG: FAD-binding oxidoreductase [Proteobacteria bacterium]|nr:FAD-binding oxidoreductase [Pseudomonadota bacterium]